ncbi:MAG TPA: 30S ribosomal protein S18 [Candidatus Polarisedimenticolia bacterium]|jgi:small subunit ribosomal protein S18|nr:30S ribosomal protein S18 [Candidatus Polarisedimenticolia bacterium]
MPRGHDGPSRDGGRGRKPFKRKFLFRKKKFCKFCEDKVNYIDYKDVRLLQGFIPERAKIFPRRISGTCSKHQRKVMHAIKRARILALVPFTSD